MYCNMASINKSLHFVFPSRQIQSQFFLFYCSLTFEADGNDMAIEVEASLH